MYENIMKIIKAVDLIIWNEDICHGKINKT